MASGEGPTNGASSFMIASIGAEGPQARFDALAEPFRTRIADETGTRLPQAALRGDHDRVALTVDLVA